MGSNAPTAGCHGKTRAVVSEWTEEGGSVVEGHRGGVHWCSLSAEGAGKDGLVHATHGATHGVGLCRRMLVVSPCAGSCCADVVVIHAAAMCAAVVLVVKTLDWHGGRPLGFWLPTLVGAAATVVAAAATNRVLVATVVAAAAAVHVLVATTTTIAVTTTAFLATATVAAATTIVATLELSTAASATWALLVVDDARRGLAIADGLA